MILHWMAYAALCAALFGLAAASVDSIFGGWRRARRGVWIAAIGASIFVPLALPVLSSIGGAPATPAPVATVQDASASVASSLAERRRRRVEPVGRGVVRLRRSSSHRPPSYDARAQTLPRRHNRRSRGVRLAGLWSGRRRATSSSHRRARVDARAQRSGTGAGRCPRARARPFRRSASRARRCVCRRRDAVERRALVAVVTPSPRHRARLRRPRHRPTAPRRARLHSALAIGRRARSRRAASCARHVAFPFRARKTL